MIAAELLSKISVQNADADRLLAWHRSVRLRDAVKESGVTAFAARPRALPDVEQAEEQERGEQLRNGARQPGHRETQPVTSSITMRAGSFRPRTRSIREPAQMPTSDRDQRDGEGTTVQSRSRMAINVTKLPTVPDGRARRQAVDAAARTIPRQGDWQAMAAGMLRLAQDAALFGRMGSAGRTPVATNYSTPARIGSL
jgi:hypothetical protein